MHLFLFVFFCSFSEVTIPCCLLGANWRNEITTLSITEQTQGNFFTALQTRCQVTLDAISVPNMNHIP